MKTLQLLLSCIIVTTQSFNINQLKTNKGCIEMGNGCNFCWNTKIKRLGFKIKYITTCYNDCQPKKQTITIGSGGKSSLGKCIDKIMI